MRSRRPAAHCLTALTVGLLVACSTSDPAQPGASGTGASAVETPFSVSESGVSEPALPESSATPDSGTDSSTTAAQTGTADGAPTDPVPSSSPIESDPAAQLGARAVVPWGLVTAGDIRRAAELVVTLSVAQRAGSVVMASSATSVGGDEVGRLNLAGVNLLGTKGVIAGTSEGRPSQVAAVTSTLRAQLAPEMAGFPLLIATDQEYGTVTRLINGFTELPGAGSLGSVGDLHTATALTRQAAQIAATEMLAVGINLDFAPVSDLLPLRGTSSIGDRSYGSDPDRVAALVGAAVAGYQDGGVAATLKHFPGIGELSADSHTTLSTVTADCAAWNRRASVPIRGGVDAGASMVMTGHTLFPAVDSGSEPTSLSSVVLTDLLRGSPGGPSVGGCTPIGYTGVSISDSFVMAPILNAYGTGEAAWRAIAAGQDVVLMPKSPSAAVDGIAGAVADGSLPGNRLNEAAVRVFALRSALGRSPQPDLASVASAEHRAAARTIWNAIG